MYIAYVIYAALYMSQALLIISVMTKPFMLDDIFMDDPDPSVICAKPSIDRVARSS